MMRMMNAAARDASGVRIRIVVVIGSMKIVLLGEKFFFSSLLSPPMLCLSGIF